MYRIGQTKDVYVYLDLPLYFQTPVIT
ncbi:SWF/SNF helicase family protein [Escherichia coli]|nr:SWF/SNF helicase family protein [Salmonella enterica subsp. enterica serovar Kentucky]EEU9466979.1 SWF/SNF helicase family protein [Escherichia coli]EFB6253252.1 SWF/SNF helicase family protein [Escherichia coli]EFC1453318.1 SWF/SNF helicase family protein [Escherichia coli]EFC4498631.1 SWF/SNF helicase family protein [Escherichia coli]